MRDLRGSKVLVTGAGGFLARHLVPKLAAQGAEVVGMDLAPGVENARRFKSKARLVEGDITDYASIERAADKCDYVIHLAAIAAPLECEKRPERAFLVNVQGTFNVLRFAQKKGARKFIFSSSAHVYGISPKYMPTDEKHPLALQDTYTTSKILGESLCQLFYSNHNLEYVTSRLYNAYGPGQNEDYFIPAMISKAKAGRIELRGRQVTKDFVFVEDVAEAFVKALTSDFVGEVNIGSGKQTTLEFVADHIARAFRAKLTFSTAEAAGSSWRSPWRCFSTPE